jgi:2-dehydro-3-deoxygluconokinase
MLTSLDVVRSKRMLTPDSLWPCLPHIDIFLCNDHEAWRLTGFEEPSGAAHHLRSRGARAAIIKLGAQGCWLDSDGFQGRISAPKVEVVDTTGAGDAFAAGLIQAILRGKSLQAACYVGNVAGARAVAALGAIGGWLTVVP